MGIEGLTLALDVNKVRIFQRVPNAPEEPDMTVRYLRPLLTITVAFASVAGVLHAQDGGSLIEQLNLTADQKTQIRKLREQFKNETESIRTAISQLQKEVRQLKSVSPVNEMALRAKLKQQADKEIELSLAAKPEGFFSGIVFFGKERDLLAFVDEAKVLSFETRRQAASVPAVDASLIEYFDEQALRFILEKFPDVPADAVGAIFFEQETMADSEDALLEKWNELLEKHNADLERSWFTTNEQDREKLREFRHALPVSVNERVVKNKQRKVGTDMAVPDGGFASFLRYYKETLNASGLEYVIFGHIGDCHLHANILPKNANEAEKARHIYGRCVAQAIMLGGTVSAEHGIGKLKRKYLAAMMGERYLNEMADLKKAFDPNSILGRGNMFDETFLNL